ncbi:DinB family protein [Iamia sp. SCSIO 61187]|nr:VOC family protein [Iamia sp. SCSIO 61187]QYG93990.1 DinB family protein [Iamia sp. SCSIO 61187]
MVDDRTVPLDWHEQAQDQLAFHWEHHVRPRLEGLTDAELHWEPVPGCWGVRPRADARSSHAAGAGEWVIDLAVPEPDPPPFTTIAWRLWHVIEGVLGGRASAHFGDGTGIDHQGRDHAPGAAGTLAALDDAYARWTAGVRDLGPAGMARACGPHEGPDADAPFGALVLHINREVIHHLAEVLTLRDLHRVTGGRALPAAAVRRDPAPLTFQVTFDAVDPHAQARFWAAVMHYEVEDHDGFVRGLLDQGIVTDDAVVAIDGRLHFRQGAGIRPPGADEAETSENKRILFMAVPEPRVAKNRVHLDLHAGARDDTEEGRERFAAEVARVVGLGATVLHRHDEADGRWVTLADPEGNELCLA